MLGLVRGVRSRNGRRFALPNSRLTGSLTSPGEVLPRPGRGAGSLGAGMPVTDDMAAMSVTVVDDEPWALDVLVRAARSWHYDCQPATSAEQALHLLERRPT